MPTHNWTEQTLSLINARLEALIPNPESPLFTHLFHGAHHSLLANGKRLRPLLTLAFLQDLNIPLDEGLDPACALEILHTYSLIHDDLPCMDNANLRRGKPTLHTIYDEAHALLTGDMLLTLAFEVISNAPELKAEVKVKLTQLLAKRAGGNGMVGGQLIDMTSEGKAISKAHLDMMYQNKTGALIAAALEFGGLIGGIPEQEQMVLQSLGYRFGVIFQMIDDLLDHHSDSLTIGKSTRCDQKNHKSTALEMYGYDETVKIIETFFREAKETTLNWPTLGMLIENYQEKIPRTCS